MKNPTADYVKEIYETIVYKTSGSVPIAEAIGGFGINDRYFQAHIPFYFGLVQIDFRKQMSIDKDTFDFLCSRHEEFLPRSMYSVADLTDFAFGFGEIKGQLGVCDEFFEKSKSKLQGLSAILCGDIRNEASVEFSCLVSELSLKAALSHVGLSLNELKNKPFKHDLIALAARLVSERPTRDDSRFQNCIQKFPNYVNSRYSSTGLSSFQLVELALMAQYVAGHAARAITTTRFAYNVEEDGRFGLREFP